MLKLIPIIVYLSFLLVSPELKKMRAYYVLISKDETAAISLKEIAKNSSGIPTNISAAYSAAAEMALAQYKFNPISKLNTFNAGKKNLEAAIILDSTEIEVRYIRLSVQQNAPSFLGYNTSILKDRNYLIYNVRSIKISDPDLFSSISTYLLTRCKLSEKEKNAIHY